MDDGVAYMVMGEGGDAGQQATQVVAVDNGDGTQQLVSVFLWQFSTLDDTDDSFRRYL